MSETPRTDEAAQYRYGRVDEKWPSASFARGLERELAAARAELAALRAELDKLSDPVAVHINMLRGTIATPSRELMEHVWAEPQPVPLDRPDKVGDWWQWAPLTKEWIMCHITHLGYWPAGKWLPAAPPRDLREGEA